MLQYEVLVIKFFSIDGLIKWLPWHTHPGIILRTKKHLQPNVFSPVLRGQKHSTAIGTLSANRSKETLPKGSTQWGWPWLAADSYGQWQHLQSQYLALFVSVCLATSSVKVFLPSALCSWSGNWRWDGTKAWKKKEKQPGCKVASISAILIC